MANCPREPPSMPHLRDEAAEFLALADAEAVVEGCTIPMHSHVLARSSRVFAQLFNSMEESGGLPRPTSVTDLFAGETLATALVTLYLMYNTDRQSVECIFELQRWCPDRTWDVDIALDPALLQSCVGLADKLDARKLLHEVEEACTRGYMLQKDLLGWLSTGMRLHLSWLRDRALTNMVSTLQDRNYDPAMDLLRDPRWKELDNSMLLLLIDALTAYKYRVGRAQFRVDTWQAMGDLTATTNSARGVIPPAMQPAGHQALELLPHLQMEQLIDDWGDEFDELEGLVEEEEEEEDEGEGGEGEDIDIEV